MDGPGPRVVNNLPLPRSMFPVYTGNYRDLQPAFIRDVSVRRQADPVGPLHVVVPGHLVRLALRRALGGGQAWLNIHFVTLNELARTVAAPRLRGVGWRPLSDTVRDPLMLSVIDALHGELSHFTQISSRPGFRRAAWRTLDELRHCGLSSGEFARLASASQGISNTLRRKLTDLARLWSAVDALYTRHHLADRLTLLEIAAHTEADTHTPVILYGLDRLSALEHAFVSRLAADSLVAAFVPYANSPDYEWTLPLVQQLTAQGGRVQVVGEHTPPRDALRALQQTFDSPGPDLRSERPPDDSLHFISAPSRDREIEFVVRRLLHSDPPTAPPARTVAVISRQTGPYSDLLREELGFTNIQGYLHQCRTLGQTATGKALRLFARLLDGRLRRVDVAALLLVVRARSQAGDEVGADPIPGAEWNHWSAEAGIVEGAPQWHDRLTRLQRRIEYQLSRQPVDDDSSVSELRRCSASVVALREFITVLSERIEGIRRAATWGRMAQCFQSAACDLMGNSEFWEDTTAELEAVELLDELRVPLTVEAFRSLLDAALSRPVEREGRFQLHQPAVLPAEQAVGLMFDDVYLTGLVEKEWPRAFPTDPLLSDQERWQLQRATGRIALSTRDDHDRRERFLFACAVAGANHRLTVSWPRSEPSTGRERLASSFVLRAAAVFTGLTPDYAALDKLVRLSSSATRIPLQRLSEPSSTPCASEFQWNLQRIAAALAGRTALPLADLALRIPAYARALEQERNAYARREFTRYDGALESPDLLAELNRARGESAAATQLEQYATCPYRYFAAHLLALAEQEPADGLFELTRQERGTLVHEILERFYAPVLEQRDYRIHPAEWQRLVAVAVGVLREHELNRLTITPFAWTVERDRLLRMLRLWFDAECADETAFRPVALESTFGTRGRSAEGQREPFLIDLGDDERLALHGRIDRIDELGDGSLRVIDYKTGRRNSRLLNGNLDGGRALQLPIYLAAAARLQQRPVASARYAYVGEQPQPAIAFTAADARAQEAVLNRTLRTLTAGLRAGLFVPRPDAETCKTCTVREVCGQSRLTHKADLDLDQTRAFRALRAAVPPAEDTDE